MFPTVSTCHR